MASEDDTSECNKTIEANENFCKLADNDHSKYKYEENRLNSFSSWPAHYPVNPSRLAKSGFFSLGNENEVVCFSCGGSINDWQFGDIVHKKHKDLFPKCDFINNKSDNVPFFPLKSNADMVNIKKITQKTCKTSVPEADLSALKSSFKNVDNEKLPFSLNYSDVSSVISSSRNDSRRFSNCDGVSNLEFNCEKMISEKERLETFKSGWPQPNMNVVELAKAGFFYLGYKDKVQCAFCHGVVSNWEDNDIPIVEHSRHFPMCKFVKELQSSKLDGSNDSCHAKGQDVCGWSDEPFKPDRDVTSDTYKLIDKTQQHTKLEELGVRIYKGPVHPQQATMQARLRTFFSWPETIPVQKEGLAAAGFFYIGLDDHTKCFHCDGGLCYWEAGDDPWVEHARWFRNCSFVHLNKGDDFIRSCIERNSQQSHSEMERYPHSRLQLNRYECTRNSDAMQKVDEFMKTNMIDAMQKVDEFMKTNMIDAIVKTGVFPLHIIKAAVLKQVQEYGCPFSNTDELCETVSLLKEKISVDLRHDIPSSSNLTNAKKNSSLMDPKSSSISQEKQSPGSERSEDSKLEDKFLKDQRLCKVCMDRDVGVVFLPCGHLLACTICAPALNDCPWCRKVIQATVRAYLP